MNKNIIPDGYVEIEWGTTIESGDIFITKTGDRHNCSSSIGKSYGIDSEGFSDGSSKVYREQINTRFKIGQKVRTTYSTFQHKGVIVGLNQKGSVSSIPDKTLYLIRFENISISSDITAKSLDVVFYEGFIVPDDLPKIGDYEVSAVEGGIKVGCQFVPDEIILKIAKIGN